MAGESLAERGFDICDVLGEGAFGKVLKAKCRDDDQFYAIKCIPLSNGTSPKYIERELKLLMKLELSERNVIKYYKSWTLPDRKQLYIQMELCSVNLMKFIYENDMAGAEIIKAQDPRLYSQVFPQILNGLDAIHSIGWIHRDIHLGNILVKNPSPQRMKDIRIKVADFGLARHVEPDVELHYSPGLTVTPILDTLSRDLGHEWFRAPELSKKQYNSKVDLYSAGIVLYLLACYLPNKNHMKDEIMALRDGKRSPKDLYHQDDEKLNKAIPWLLQPDPNERPSAAQALAFLRSQENRSQQHTQSVTKKFLVKKHDDDILYRCSSSDYTLSSIQAAIETHHCIGIDKDDQILRQEKTIENEKRLLGLTCDEDAREMFDSAEENSQKVIIVVSEKKRKKWTKKH